MAEAAVPVDLFNPGQVFACIGLVEVADELLGDAQGTFDWSDANTVLFRLRANGNGSPVIRVMEFLENASAVAIAPEGSLAYEAWKTAWGPAPSLVPRGHGYPFPDPPSPATLVCKLSDGKHEICIEHYGDGTNRDNVKFWAGAGVTGK